MENKEIVFGTKALKAKKYIFKSISIKGTNQKVMTLKEVKI